MSRSAAGFAAVAWAVAACGGSQPTTGPSVSAAAPQDTSTDSTTVEVSLDEQEQVAAIEHAVTSNADAVYACWKHAAADDFRLGGQVVLSIRFAAPANEISVVVDQPGNAVLSSCLVELYQRHVWPVAFVPGTEIQLPFEFVAPAAQYTVHREHVKAEPIAAGGWTEHNLLHRANTGNDRARLALLTVAGGRSVPVGAADGAHLVYVHGGTGTVVGQEVSAGAGIYLRPGRQASFAAGAGGAELVLLAVPGGADDATAPVVVRRAEEAEPLSIAGGKARVELLFDASVVGGHRAGYLGVLTAEPALQIPEHVHVGETELLYVVQGRGTMTVAGNEYPVVPDLAIQIPPNTPHSLTVASDVQLRAIQFYTPSGPEQRFRQ